MKQDCTVILVPNGQGHRKSQKVLPQQKTCHLKNCYMFRSVIPGGICSCLLLDIVGLLLGVANICYGLMASYITCEELMPYPWHCPSSVVCRVSSVSTRTIRNNGDIKSIFGANVYDVAS